MTADSDSNDLPDWWETKHFGGLGNVATNDFDLDGLSNLVEFQQGSDPKNYFSQGGDLIVPALEVASGNGQLSAPSTFVANPIVVRVKNSVTNALLENAPVTFTVTSTGGQVAASNVGTPVLGSNVEVRSDASGLARAYFKQPETHDTGSTLTATAAAITLTGLTARTNPETPPLVYKTVATGTAHTLTLKNDGSVWAFGNNSSGQLGIGSLTNTSVPVHLTTLTNVAAVAAGEYHSLVLKSDGSVWAFGNNQFGQAGTSTSPNLIMLPIMVNGLSDVISVAAGKYHSVGPKI